MSPDPCPVCGSPKTRLRRTLRDRFRVRRCAGCRFTWVDRADLADPGASADYRDYFYNNNIFRHFEAMKPLYAEGLGRRVARTLGRGSLGGRSFLDVGCAHGEYMATAKALGFGLVAGVEVDEVAAARARAHGEVRADLRDLSCDAFDIVHLKNVLSNILDFRAFMGACLRALKPGGFLLLDVLNQDSLSSRARVLGLGGSGDEPRYGVLRPPYVINGFTKGSLVLFLRQVGLTPTLVAFARRGSAMVPYPPSHALGLVSALSVLLYNSMILSESAKAPAPGGAAGAAAGPGVVYA